MTRTLIPAGPAHVYLDDFRWQQPKKHPNDTTRAMLVMDSIVYDWPAPGAVVQG